MHDTKRQKELVEKILISMIRYGLEKTRGGLDREIILMQRRKSRAARLVLRMKQKDWSCTFGLKDLGCLVSIVSYPVVSVLKE